MRNQTATRLSFCVICAILGFASIEPVRSAEQLVVLHDDSLSLNGVVIGEVSDQRAKLSLPALVEVLGTPNRTENHNHTHRTTWDTEGIQLEATEPESVPFAVLLQYAASDVNNQAIVPIGQFRGTLDCLGIELRAGEPLADREKILGAAGFNKQEASNATEMWSVRLPHWAVYLRLSAAGTIDSAVIRVLPDIY
jgi:hypothetical protein